VFLRVLKESSRWSANFVLTGVLSAEFEECQRISTSRSAADRSSERFDS